MHIPDGFLSPGLAATAWIVAGACLAGVLASRPGLLLLDELLSDQMLLRRHGLD